MKRHRTFLLILVMLLIVACTPQFDQQSRTMEGQEEIDANEDFFALLENELGKNGPSLLSTGEISIMVDGARLQVQPMPFIEDNTTLLPLRAVSTHFGAGVWWNGATRTVGINQGNTQIAFVVGASQARVNGRQVNIPTSKIVNGSTFVPIRFISETFGYRVGWDGATRTVTIDTTPHSSPANNTNSPNENKPPNPDDQTNNNPASSNNGVTISYITHTVQAGENPWNLSLRYGIPMLQLLKENNLSMNSSLSIGQKLRIPIYNVPVKPTTSQRHGELLDWWTEARYIFSIGKEATVTDFQSGRTFRIRHTMGGNHADAEPLTAQDAQIMREIWGGQYSWTPRAIILTLEGRKLAAAMHSFPHSDQAITTNNYNGHFCIHFLNSTRHNDGLIQESMQNQVRVAAGVNK
ncbi:stalk domain-containing protein [Caldalkalibacillus mannanilyticus]|uniref:stalk domain-containing protein n=1 Tax=Caldalkalibacillus mannanilyticus TaxID=1418 RepID=UPI00046AC269|nr:stalk domain-containing protein [Caldalkalibacillus mannanilyticus]